MNTAAKVFADLEARFQSIVEATMVSDNEQEMVQKYHLAPRNSFTASYLECAILARRHDVARERVALAQDEVEQLVHIHQHRVNVLSSLTNQKERGLMGDLIYLRSEKIGATIDQFVVNANLIDSTYTVEENVEHAVRHAAQCDNVMVLSAYVTMHRVCGRVFTSMVYEARWLEIMHDYKPVNLMC